MHEPLIFRERNMIRTRVFVWQLHSYESSVLSSCFFPLTMCGASAVATEESVFGELIPLVVSALVKLPYIGHVREKLGFDSI